MFLPQPSWGIQDVSSLQHVCVSTPLMARDHPSHSRGFPLPEACIRNGRRVSEATYPHTGDSTAGAQSQAGGSGQAGSAVGNNSHGHSEGDTGVSLGSKEPLPPTRTPNPKPHPNCGTLCSFYVCDGIKTIDPCVQSLLFPCSLAWRTHPGPSPTTEEGTVSMGWRSSCVPFMVCETYKQKP